MAERATLQTLATRTGARIGHGGGPGDVPLPDSRFVRAPSLSQYVSETAAPAPAGAVATGVTPLGIEESLYRLEELERRKREDLARRRHATFQEPIEPPSGGPMLAAKSSKAGGMMRS